MILILTRPAEYSTNKVIEWIQSLGGCCKRLNDTFLYHSRRPFAFFINSEKEGLNIPDQDQSLDIEKINVVWYRKWSSSDSLYDLLKLSDNKEWATNIFNHISREISASGSALFNLLKEKVWLDNPNTVKGIKKNEVLSVARSLGLKVPNTIITNNKTHLLQFLDVNRRIISKPISEITFFNNDHFEFLSYTREITADFLSTVSDWFYPSQFQELIEKKFDIRTFFLDGKCYSMAILSQKDKKSEIDFRNYDAHRPNRMIPFRLPEEIEEIIVRLMDKLNLITGSLDLIMTPAGAYYFLEVNPVGQFGMTSYPCNYQLEKKIAQYLISHDKK